MMLSWALGCVAAAAAPSSLPAYLVPFRAAPIHADGKLNEAAWTEVPWSRDFVWIDVGDAAPERSRFKAVYGPEGLHFAFEFAGAVEPVRPLDPDFPRACEIFLDPQGRGRRYLEYAVAPDGAEHATVWAGRLSIQEWSSTLGPTGRVGVGRVADGPGRERIVYEISFPWKALASLGGGQPLPPKKGTAWRANFSRVEPGADFSWSPCGVYYMHHPNTFGWLVFAGEHRPVQEISPAAIQPLPDDVEQLRIDPTFAQFSSTYWVSFPLTAAASGDRYVVLKTAVERVDPSGRTRFAKTRRDGLPQFIRSIAPSGEDLYVAGNGIGAGLYRLDRAGKVTRLGPNAGYLLDGPPALLPLDSQRCLATVGERFQWIDKVGFSPAASAGGTINCAVRLSGGPLILGTSAGCEMHSEDGKYLARTAVAGGITTLVRLGDAAIGASGKGGLYRVDARGQCRHFPSPLRIKFDILHVDAQDRCWASFVGGIALIQEERLQLFHEPLGLAGVRITAAASIPGESLFLATVANATYYQSSPFNRFLLSYKGTAWKKLTYGEGLPGQPAAITSLDGQLYLSTTRGVFHYRHRE
jgi:hypothetical protein